MSLNEHGRMEDFLRNETPEQKARRLGVPLIPKLKPAPQPNRRETVAVCGECGLEIGGVMSYVCPRSNCPTGLGSPYSLSPEKAVDVVKKKGPDLVCADSQRAQRFGNGHSAYLPTLDGRERS